MSIEEMLKFLGVKTQSLESIKLCYQIDLEAFNMMDGDFSYELKVYNAVYKVLLHELNYELLDDDNLNNYNSIIYDYNIDEPDKDYRDLYFTGLERVLLRYNHHNLIAFQRIPLSDHIGIAKDAYLYELNENYEKAMLYYNKIGDSERYSICLSKSSK